MSKNWAIISIFVIVFLWLSWFLYLILAFGFPTSGSQAEYQSAGQFGDSFGILASLMSSLAVIGALYSIYNQNINYNRQQFESNFYVILSNIRKERDEIKISIANGPIDKNLSESFSYTKLKEHLENETHSFHGYRAINIALCKIREEISPSGYDNPALVFEKYRNNLKDGSRVDNYFRQIYHLYNMLDKSDVKEKNFYARIIRSQITSSEACLLAYNCSIGVGKQKFICLSG